MVNELLSWGALVAAGGSIVAIISFWMQRGRNEAETAAKADGASAMAAAAVAKAEMVSLHLADARVEMARDFVTHAQMDAVRFELRGMNERLDRIIEGFVNK